MYVCICQNVKEGEVEVRHLTNTRCSSCFYDLLAELKTKLPEEFYEQIVETSCIEPKKAV